MTCCTCLPPLQPEGSHSPLFHPVSKFLGILFELLFKSVQHPQLEIDEGTCPHTVDDPQYNCRSIAACLHVHGLQMSSSRGVGSKGNMVRGEEGMEGCVVEGW